MPVDLVPAVPQFDPCHLLLGPARSACDAAKGISGGAAQAASFVSDPFGTIAKDFASAATWLIDKLAHAVTAMTQVDFTNPGFLREYAVVFGATTFLTLILWLIAVAKRAVRGVPVGQAIGEAVGFLWLAVVASAFTPLALSLVVALTDSVTNALLSGTGADTTRFLTGVSKALTPSLSGGPVLLVIVSLFAIAAAALIWVELLIRAAMLYVGGVLGCAVYAGLVDRDLWRHVRRWAGVMLAVDLAKPVLVIVLGLAAAVTANSSEADPVASVLSGLAIMFLSIFTSVFVYKFVPTFGDDMAHLYAGRKMASNAGPAAAIPGPASYMRQGIATHASRGGTSAMAGAGAATVPAAAAGVAAGIAAHGVTNGARAARERVAPRPGGEK